MRMPFGKYRDQDLDDIPDSYLLWVLNNVESLNPFLRRAILSRLDLDEPAPSPPPPRPNRGPDLSRLRDEVMAEVRRVRRRLAAQMHPDRGGDVRAMQLVNAAADELEAAVQRTFDSSGYCA